MADRTAAEIKPKCTPAELMLKVILTGTLSHYETRGMIDDKRLEHMLSAGKQILYKTHQESDVRYVDVFLSWARVTVQWPTTICPPPTSTPAY